MLNYIWAGLIISAFVFAVGYDVRDLTSDAYRNGAPLPVALAFPSGYDTAARRVPVEIRIDPRRYAEFYRLGSGAWNWLPEVFDASILSDEVTAPGAPNFTGAFVGVACQDMSGTAKPADFDWFEYRERDYLAGPTA